jgi:uncharacterized protein (TIGR02246 family)
MKSTISTLALSVLTTLTCWSQPAPSPASLTALARNAQEFVDSYNKADPEALAKHFLPEGEIVLANGELVKGRGEIAEFYTTVFSGEAKPKGALEAGSVRFVTPGIAVEDGTFHVTLPSGEVISHYYTAVHVKQENGSWLTASLRDELEDRAPAAEKLLGLSWIVGDWMIEREGTRTLLSFSWSKEGPFIDGKALTEEAGEESISTTYRIGWDAHRKGFVSWGFDAQGGHSKAEWSPADNGWLLRASGVTADGETNQSTQQISPNPSLQSFDWSTRDHTLNGESQPDSVSRVVKRPPPPPAEEESTTEASQD